MLSFDHIKILLSNNDVILYNCSIQIISNVSSSNITLMLQVTHVCNATNLHLCSV